ncbi:MAG TPA: hypothetical protein VFX79_02145 [Candidatus Saccharimonadales bacterium]|nr:hypothetical protein [Candidatus Saccharimonadales bacterium]
MVAKPDSLNHRGAYVPASAQKSIAQHLDRTMPTHLRKYQQGGYVPKHAERAMSQHLQKTLPNRLKKHADPYLQQNVMWGNNAKSSTQSEPAKASPVYRPTVSSASSSTFEKQFFSPDNPQSGEQPSSPNTPAGGQDYQQAAPPSQGGSDYDFIMNSPSSGGPSFLGPQNTKMRIAVFAVGIILLIILMSVFFSFLNSAGNKQKENLLEVTKTQQEILRIINANKQSISDGKLKDKTETLRVVMLTSQQEFTAALSARGKKVSPKELETGRNPQNDAILEAGEAEARGDEVFDELLTSLLTEYSAQLQAVYESGNQSEQELATEAFNQVDLIYNLSQSNASTSAEEAPASQ